MYVTIAGYKTRLCIRIGKAVAATNSNASIREKRIGDIRMFKREGCLPGCLAEKAGSSVVSSVT